MRTIIGRLVVVATLASTGLWLSDSASAAGTCGWYAIAGCFKNKGSADSRARALGDAYTVKTSNISNFANGWYCAVDGPYRNKQEANVMRKQFRRDGVGDAYVKKGGC